MNKKKLLIVTNVDWFFVSHRMAIGLEAIKQGYDVYIVTSITTERAKLLLNGFYVCDVPLNRSGASLLGLIKIIYIYLKIFWKIRPDIVHLVTIKPVLLGGLAALMSPVKGVVFAISGLGHVFIGEGVKNKLRKSLVSLFYKIVLLKRNSHFIFQNEDDANIILGKGRVKNSSYSLIKGSGINVSKYEVEPFPRDKFVVLMASRLLKSKGLQEYLDAAEYITNQLKKNEIEFLLCGEPDYSNPASISEIEYKEIKNSSFVKSLGYVSNIKKFIGMSNLCVLPSYREGFPKFLMEASACGRPMITTDVPGCRDAIAYGANGLLISPKNHKELIDAIFYFYTNKFACEKMGANAREYALKNFEIESVVTKHLEIYTTLINN